MLLQIFRQFRDHRIIIFVVVVVEKIMMNGCHSVLLPLSALLYFPQSFLYLFLQGGGGHDKPTKYHYYPHNQVCVCVMAWNEIQSRPPHRHEHLLTQFFFIIIALSYYSFWFWSWFFCVVPIWFFCCWCGMFHIFVDVLYLFFLFSCTNFPASLPSPRMRDATGLLRRVFAAQLFTTVVCLPVSEWLFIFMFFFVCT